MKIDKKGNEKKIKSIFSIQWIKNLNEILDSKEKLKFLNIVIFAIIVAGFEVLTATFVMIFSKYMTQIQQKNILK